MFHCTRRKRSTCEELWTFCFFVQNNSLNFLWVWRIKVHHELSQKVQTYSSRHHDILNSSMVLLPNTVWKSINIMKFVLHMYVFTRNHLNLNINSHSFRWKPCFLIMILLKFEIDPQIKTFLTCFTFSESILGISVGSTMISMICHWYRPATSGYLPQVHRLSALKCF